MDINESLVQATTLFGIGMTFVFSFLGLLMIAVKLMAKYIPADEVVAKKRSPQKKVASTPNSEINPRIIAAITCAVQQYHKADTV